MADYENTNDIMSEKPSWQHGKLGRPEVQALLPPTEGAFLVREGRVGNVLSVYTKGSVQHFIIKDAGGGQMRIDDGPLYRTLPELINFYMTDPASPTRLTKPIRRVTDPTPLPAASGASPPPALAPRGGGKARAPAPPLPTEPAAAPPLMPRSPTGQVMPQDPAAADNMYGNVASMVIADPDPPAPAAAPAAEPTARMEPARFEPTSQQRKDFNNLDKVKKVNDAKGAVEKIQLATTEVEQDDGAWESNKRRIQFEKEANASEKFNLFWLNNILAKIDGVDTVDNVAESLRSAVIVFAVLEHLSGKKTRYAKKPKMAVQFRDNWVSVVNFMRTLGIQVDGDGVKGTGDDETVDVSLSAEKCGELDRRELLKLFTKIMLYQNTLGE